MDLTLSFVRLECCYASIIHDLGRLFCGRRSGGTIAFARSYATMIAEGYAASLQVPHNAFSSNLHRKIENDETEKQEAKVYGITDSGC